MLRLPASAVFTVLAVYIGSLAPSADIAWVCALLLLTIYLFAFEVVPVDVAAISVMVLLGLSGPLAPVPELAEPLVAANHLFDGFAGNAVMSIIAVMIIGAGLDRTRIMGPGAIGSRTFSARGAS